jgi:hypothetical protein
MARDPRSGIRLQKCWKRIMQQPHLRSKIPQFTIELKIDRLVWKIIMHSHSYRPVTDMEKADI